MASKKNYTYRGYTVGLALHPGEALREELEARRRRWDALRGW